LLSLLDKQSRYSLVKVVEGHTAATDLMVVDHNSQRFSQLVAAVVADVR
jgi:hypothetical protein